MALRKVLTDDHPSLKKVCRPYTVFGDRLNELLDDMADTLAEQNGVGLAAPQIGIIRRVCIVLETNVEEDEEEYLIELINPEIILEEGEQVGYEGCLSYPGRFGIVKRPDHVVVRAQNRQGETFEVEGYGLTARAFCHEIDHLNGIVYIDKAEKMLTEEELAHMGEEEDEEE